MLACEIRKEKQVKNYSIASNKSREIMSIKNSVKEQSLSGMFKLVNPSPHKPKHHHGPIKYTFNRSGSIINAPNQPLGR